MNGGIRDSQITNTSRWKITTIQKYCSVSVKPLCPSFCVMMNVTCARHQSMMCFRKLPIHSFSLPPKALCHILHLSLDQPRGATCSDCLRMQRALSFLFCCKQAWALWLFTLAKHHSVWRQVHTNISLQKSICYFDNCICHQNCICWLEIVPCGSQLWQYDTHGVSE